MLMTDTLVQFGKYCIYILKFDNSLSGVFQASLAKHISINLETEGSTLKLSTFLIISALSATGFFGLTILSARIPISMTDAAISGKEVWQTHQCVSCHALFGNGGYNAEDLTNIVGSKTPEQVRRYLINPPVMRPNTRKLHPGLTASEAENLVEYLRFVYMIPTLGWPPHQNGSGGL